MQNYHPKYNNIWPTIKEYIFKNWKLAEIKNPKTFPYPFLTIAPDGREVMFYWDTYFTNIGLFFIKEAAQYAVNNINNLFHEVEQYGFVPNASELWGINRSQPPYLAMMVRDVYEKTTLTNETWLKKAFHILKIEYQFWMDELKKPIENHVTPITPLIRYAHHSPKKELLDLYQSELTTRLGFERNIPEKEKIRIAAHHAAEAESGMDFTPRFEKRCLEFVAVDLNSNLYFYEMNFAWLSEKLKLDNAQAWLDKAEKRKEAIHKFLWNDARGLFLDYDFINKRHSKIATLLTFSPLFVKLATTTQAQKIRDNLPLFEREWGLSVCEETNQDRFYQWGYPAAWAPMHFLVIKALDQYGFTQDAKRIAAKYCDLVAHNYIAPFPVYYNDGQKKYKRKPGAMYEKYDALTGKIFDVEYPANIFFGWTSGVFLYAYHYLLTH